MANLADNALTNLADVKESLGIAGSDHSYDNLIIRKINQVSNQIERYCDRKFKKAIYTDELYNGQGTTQLVLKQRPIDTNSPFTLSSRNSALNDDSFTDIQSDWYYIKSDSGVVDLLLNLWGSYGRWKVTYSAGYDTIPDDLAEAAAALAAYYTVNAEPGLIGTQLVKEGSREIRYANTTINFMTLMQNLGVDAIINSYANSPVMTDA